MVQIYKAKQATKREPTEATEETPSPVKNEQLDADTLDILDEIDEALGHLTEAEAQTMVSEYIQKGGQ